MLATLKRIFQGSAYECHGLADPRLALDFIENHPIDLVVTDLRMPGMSGMDLLLAIKGERPELPVLVMTGGGSVDSAVECMKRGAADYLNKPFAGDELKLRVEQALKNTGLLRENRVLKEGLRTLYGFQRLVGKSAAMEAIYRTVEKAAFSDSTVLISGESGTGKELAARAIHFSGPRKDAPFVSVDCGAIAENLLESELFGHVKGAYTGAHAARPGLFAAADTGTIFLDEIGNMPAPMQMKILRVLQEREVKPVGSEKSMPVDIRVIAASHEDLEALVAQNRFRQDLFYRLNVIQIALPPLRERTGDLALLCEHLLKKYAGGKKLSISPEAMASLERHPWPGNVRELENVIERAVAVMDGEVLGLADLPAGFQRAAERTEAGALNNRDLKKAKKEARRRAVEEIEKAFVEDALSRHQGNVTRATEEVGMDRANFHALMRKYKLRVSGPRP